MEDQQIRALLEKCKRLQHEAFIKNFNICIEEWAWLEINSHDTLFEYLIAHIDNVCEVAIQLVRNVRQQGGGN